MRESVLTPSSRTAQQGVLGGALVVVVLWLTSTEAPEEVVASLTVLATYLVSLFQNWAEARGRVVLPTLGKVVPSPGDS